MRFINSVCIDASPAKVWHLLADIEHVSLWAEPIVESTCPGPSKTGVGAQRLCRLKGNMTVRETWTAWDEGHSFTYTGEGIPFTKTAKNTWSIREEGGKTLLTSVADIEFQRGILGSLMGMVMRLSMKRQAPRILATFKYWVENGKPYTGNASALKPGPAVC